MNKRTIAEHMRDVLIENDCEGVMWGDCGLLDECADRATHTTLMKAHALDRHQRILNALDRSPLFEKFYIKLPIRCFPKSGWMERPCRSFLLKEVKR